jgi:hypothetical protein|tara:strand:- start:313 stop:1011 length:699 start_codon:yes stop_codon:yes gene_type:complete
MIHFDTYLAEEELSEGVYDPGILKAFFTAGGPGSGKSYVTGKAGLGKFSPLGIKIINSDAQYEKLLADAKMEMTPANIFSKRGQKIRKRAKELTQAMRSGYVDGRLGLLIDGTGKDYDKIQTTSNSLRKIGYDTFMIFVNTSLDVAQKRNLMRARKLEPKQVTKMWNAVQQNIGKFQIHFGRKNIIILDNNDENESLIEGLFVRIKKLVNEPLINTIGKEWIASELEKKKRK